MKKIVLGIGRFGIWVHKVNSLWFTYPGVSDDLWVSGRSSLSSVLLFMLYSRNHFYLMTSQAASVERQWTIPGYSPWVWALRWDTWRQQCSFLNLLSRAKVLVIQSSGDPEKYPDIPTLQCPWLSAPEGAGTFVQGDFPVWFNVPHVVCKASAITPQPLLWPSWLGPAGPEKTWTYSFHKEFSCTWTTVDGGFGWLFPLFPQHDMEKPKAHISLWNPSFSAQVMLSLIKLHLNVFSFFLHACAFLLIASSK